jgi:hypothetical protein
METATENTPISSGRNMRDTATTLIRLRKKFEACAAIPMLNAFRKTIKNLSNT